MARAYNEYIRMKLRSSPFDNPTTLEGDTLEPESIPAGSDLRAVSPIKRAYRAEHLQANDLPSHGYSIDVGIHSDRL